MREVPERPVRSAEVVVPRRDGVVLRADLHLPEGEGPFPTLVLRLPYDKAQAQSYWFARPQNYAAHGYAVIVEDVRGRFRSGGVFLPLVHEREDSEDLLAWALGQPWCDGMIGLYGYSYAAYLQLLAASGGLAPQIQAISPAMAIPGLEEGCLHQNGAIAAGFLLTWAVQLGGLELEVESREALRELVTQPLHSFRDRIVPGCEEWAGAFLAQDSTDPFWARVPKPDLSAVSAHTLVVGGWYDTFRRNAFANYVALEPGASSAALVVGPWSHNPLVSAQLGEPIAPRAASWDIDDFQLQHFDYALKGEGASLEGVRLAVMNSDEVWTMPSWPPSTVERTVLWLEAGGRLVEEQPARSGSDAIEYCASRPVPAFGGDDCGDPLLQGMGPSLQTETEAHPQLRTYTTLAFTAERTLVGTGTLRLYVDVASRGPAQWVARLALVVDAQTSVNLVESVAQTDAAEGEQLVELELGEFAVRVAPGQRLRLSVARSCVPRWAPLPAQAPARILHRPSPSSSHLLLELAV